MRTSCDEPVEQVASAVNDRSWAAATKTEGTVLLTGRLTRDRTVVAAAIPETADMLFAAPDVV